MILCNKILTVFNPIKMLPLILLFFLSVKVLPQEMPVPASVQGELIPKILLLNKSFSDKKEINLGIVYNKYLRGSAETMNIISEKVKSSDIDLKIHPIPIEISELNDIKGTLNNYSLDAIYIAPLRGTNLRAIKSFCKENKIITLCGTPELIADYFSIGFDIENNKVKIDINIKTALEEGADFSSHLLKIARVINK